MGPRTFLAACEFLQYNCSAVCGMSAQGLYGVATGDLFQEGLCHMLCDPGLLQPELLSPWQATADQCLHKRHSDTQRQVWLSLFGASGSWCTQVLFEPSVHLWWVWGLILSMILPPLPSC